MCRLPNDQLLLTFKSFGLLERRIGLKRLEDQTAVVQGFVVHPFSTV